MNHAKDVSDGIQNGEDKEETPQLVVSVHSRTCKEPKNVEGIEARAADHVAEVEYDNNGVEGPNRQLVEVEPPDCFHEANVHERDGYSQVEWSNDVPVCEMSKAHKRECVAADNEGENVDDRSVGERG